MRCDAMLPKQSSGCIGFCSPRSIQLYYKSRKRAAGAGACWLRGVAHHAWARRRASQCKDDYGRETTVKRHRSKRHFGPQHPRASSVLWKSMHARRICCQPARTYGNEDKLVGLVVDVHRSIVPRPGQRYIYIYIYTNTLEGREGSPYVACSQQLII